jgi:hypothetical protein
VDDVFDIADEIERLIGIENGKTWREKKRKSRRVTVVRVDRGKAQVHVKGFKMTWIEPIMVFLEKYERVHKG